MVHRSDSACPLCRRGPCEVIPHGDLRQAIVLVCKFLIALPNADDAYVATRPSLWARRLNSFRALRDYPPRVLVRQFNVEAARVTLSPYKRYCIDELHKTTFYADSIA